MTQPFGASKEYFKHSLFLVLCNRVLTVTLALGLLLARLACLAAAHLSHIVWCKVPSTTACASLPLDSRAQQAAFVVPKMPVNMGIYADPLW